MKQFNCGDVVPGCQWVGRNEEDDELWVEIASHAREAHGMHDVPPEVADAIRDAITEVSD
jgi:predicted small metal-binding protein